jgi:hypothetical protein
MLETVLLKIAPKIRLIERDRIVLVTIINGLAVLTAIAFGDDPLDDRHIVLISIDNQSQPFFLLSKQSSISIRHSFKQLNSLVQRIPVVQRASNVRQKDILDQPLLNCTPTELLILPTDKIT